MTAGLVATPATQPIPAGPQVRSAVQNRSNLTPRPLATSNRHLDDSGPAVPTTRCQGMAGRGRCKMPGARHGGYCNWHVPKSPPEPPAPVVMASHRDRQLLGPLLARLRLWACEYDSVGESEEPTPAAEFVDWLRVELASPLR